jgi:predicted O-methyltransferase YrrM
MPFLPTDALQLPERLHVRDGQSFLRDPLLLRSIMRSTQARIVIEVGSWKGHSAIEIARAVRDRGGCVICVDTWLGSAEHWTHPDLRRHLQLECGMPTLYRRFVSNVVAAGVEDVIVPMPMTSEVAAQLLTRHGVRADVVYIDAAHEPDQVTRDLESYFRVLSPQGVVFGDDHDWSAVRQAVASFAERRQLHIDAVGDAWILGLDRARFRRLFALYTSQGGAPSPGRPAQADHRPVESLASHSVSLGSQQEEL